MKTTTMVKIFNQLTHTELADFSPILYEELLGNHYEKYRCFYDMVDEIPVEVTKSVKGFSCYCNDKSIEVIIEFSSKSKRDKYNDKLEPIISEYFNIEISVNNAKKINISIENKRKISKEEDIYENNFNTD